MALVAVVPALLAPKRDGAAIDHDRFVDPVLQPAHREVEPDDGLPRLDGAVGGRAEQRHRRRLRAQVPPLR